MDAEETCFGKARHLLEAKIGSERRLHPGEVEDIVARGIIPVARPLCPAAVRSEGAHG